ncbi:PAS and ANTAR domain-containing protein [Gordonia sp. ABSL1-1]|uniref:PAS and ANTAR domain-containing protein n=1 Tax=Gordonia sp. ABSL1-1 TaxID=3053923 RepID=UPI0025744E91|nr:PAS and ANTAR domain-containing protein [Gordonia sp. ABSL1-1]MDL9935268.1 PAS and ANTAR domain-containing protein [Gordonia sp. ABSL1-1]
MTEDDIHQVLSTGSAFRPVATFRFYFTDEHWEWSDEAAILHGYQPGEVVPTTDLLTRHKHPEDRARFEGTVAEMLAHRTPFSSRHRIIDTRGKVHSVAVIAKTFADAEGTVIGTEGFYLDLDEHIESLVNPRIEEHVQRFRSGRAVIEQVKGMMMLVYGISDERAFEVLTWRSQEENVKVTDLCAAICARVGEIAIAADNRRAFDQLLLTSHLEITRPETAPD